MMKKISFCISALLLVAVSTIAQGSGKIILNKGQKFIQETSGNVVITQEVMGQAMESKIDMKSTNTIEVIDVKDTSYSLSNTITKMKMNMSAMGQDMNYDSEKEDNDSSISRGMSKVLNNPRKVDISKTGKPINSTENNVTDSGANAMAGLQYLMGNSDAFQTIPSKASAGYSWQDSVSKDDTKLNTTYTVKELKGNDVTVSVKGTVQVNQDTEVHDMKFTTHSTGAFTGELIVDRKTGVVKQRNNTVETTGTIDIMGQQIPITTKVATETTVKSM